MPSAQLASEQQRVFGRHRRRADAVGRVGVGAPAHRLAGLRRPRRRRAPVGHEGMRPAALVGRHLEVESLRRERVDERQSGHRIASTVRRRRSNASDDPVRRHLVLGASV